MMTSLEGFSGVMWLALRLEWCQINFAQDFRDLIHPND